MFPLRLLGCKLATPYQYNTSLTTNSLKAPNFFVAHRTFIPGPHQFLNNEFTLELRTSLLHIAHLFLRFCVAFLFKLFQRH